MNDLIFREAMGKFATGVTVITTNSDDGNVHGMTANAFMSVSLKPKLISVSVDEKAHMHDKIKHAGKFAVSILSEEQKNVSMHFAGQKKEERDIDFEWVDNLPIIKNAIATIVCDLYSDHKAGDHTLYIGEVLDINVGSGRPLTFFEGKYNPILDSNNENVV